MANGIVNLVFRSIAQGSGFKDTLTQAREMKGEMGDLTESVKKLGGVAGQTGGLVGEMLSSALKGGIFGVIAAAVGVIVNLYGKWRDAARETAEAEKRAFDDRVKAVSDYSAAVEKCYQASASAIDGNLKRINAEIDATRDLVTAELELQRERARANGDDEGAERLSTRMKEVEAAADKKKMIAALDAAEAKLAAARKRKDDLEDPFGRAEENYATALAAYNKAVAKVRRDAEESARGDAYMLQSSAGATIAYRSATEEQRKAAGDAAVSEYLDTAEGRAFDGSMQAAENARNDLRDKVESAKREIAEAESHLQNLKTKADAMALRADAGLLKAQNDAADEKAKADEKAASEREAQIKREHEQRMKLIQEETAARLEQERKVQQQASSRFEREFALWLDPEARDRRFDEQEKRRADIEKMKTDVLRTGSSGRVREIAELMRAGDEEGVEKKFETWRRGGWFSGMDRDQEQLIRTAAAYETQDDAKRNIARIAENTEALSDKLDSLLKVK